MNQPSLFDYVKGKKAKEKGINAVLGNGINDAWKDAASRWILRQNDGFMFTSDDLVEAVGLPPSVNCVGAFLHSMGQRGWIVKRGFKPATRASRHGAIVALWETK